MPVNKLNNCQTAAAAGSAMRQLRPSLIEGLENFWRGRKVESLMFAMYVRQPSLLGSSSLLYCAADINLQ